MSDGRPSRVARVRSGAPHRSTLVTTWTVQLTGIEFINDYPMFANGRNLANSPPDQMHYTNIPEDFKGWGQGVPLTGWDWEGKDNLERAACYHRQKPVVMKVRLHSSIPATSDRTFTLEVHPTVDGSTKELTDGTVSVTWPSGSQEQIVTITLGGVLPNEVSRYHVNLTWSVKGIVPAGVIKVTNHKIFSLWEDPLDPTVSKAAGTALAPIVGLTKQRLDQLTYAIGGNNRRFPTPAGTDIDRLVWLLHVKVNDSGPPHFNGARTEFIQYGDADSAPTINLIDQWIMWLAGRTLPHESHPWTAGACISYVQLMKTMLAAAGINSRRAWVIPKTTLMPNGTTVALADSDLVTFDDSSGEQTFTIKKNGINFNAAVKLIDRPGGNGDISWENFEACLYYGGKLVPGAIPTSRYPASVLKAHVGFANATEVLRWWHSVNHGDFHRFMAWVAEGPDGNTVYFDKNGDMYSSPYTIPHSKQLPVP